MSLPSVKALDSHDGQSQDSNNNNNQANPNPSINGPSNDPSSAPQAQGQSRIVSGSQLGQSQGQPSLDDPYRYSQQQPPQQQPQQQGQQPPQQGQQQPGQPQQGGPPQPQQPYAYYSYQPVYSQPQYQNQYPYYQSTANPVGSTQSSQLNGVGSYPGYSDYSRVNYVQNYVPVYQNQGVTGGPQAGAVSNNGTPNAIPGSINGQNPGPTALPAANSSAVGQIQPVGSRPRVTTTMWEDEKTLCYQVDANGVSVVRRADNDMINGTKLLNVAHMTRGRRDGILKSEKVRDVVKIGSMHLKGVWIPFDRALAMAQREGIVDLLYPLFVRDIKQVIQQGSTTQPQAAPVTSQWSGYGATGSAPQQPIGYPQSQAQPPQNQIPAQPAAGQPTNNATNAPQGGPGKVSPYLTPNSLSSSALPIDQKPSVQHTSNSSISVPGATQGHQSQSSYSVPQVGGIPQQQPPPQQSYYGSVSQYPYYPQYQYAYGGNAAAGSTTNSTPAIGSSAQGGVAGQANTAQVGQTSTSAYQYPQYSYGYLPQYQNPQYDDKDNK